MNCSCIDINFVYCAEVTQLCRSGQFPYSVDDDGSTVRYTTGAQELKIKESKLLSVSVIKHGSAALIYY